MDTAKLGVMALGAPVAFLSIHDSFIHLTSSV